MSSVTLVGGVARVQIDIPQAQLEAIAARRYELAKATVAGVTLYEKVGLMAVLPESGNRDEKGWWLDLASRCQWAKSAYDTEAIKKAWKTHLIEVHPDRQINPETWQVCNEAVKECSNARDILVNPEMREEYHRELDKLVAVSVFF